MKASLQLAVGRGHLGAGVALERTGADRPRTHPWLFIAAVILTVPFTVALAVNAIGYAVHASAPILPEWLYGGGSPGAGRLMALGPPLALLLLAAARLRLHSGREDGRWTGRLTARLTGWETAIALVALAVMGLFFGHMAADAWACANGVTRAC